MDIELIMALQRSGGPTAKQFVSYVMHVSALYCNRSTKMTCKTANFMTMKFSIAANILSSDGKRCGNTLLNKKCPDMTTTLRKKSIVHPVRDKILASLL